ncbi:MAG: YbjQ family protein [Candidatus Nealsonbacteria bacterium]|nr:MAG: YbjQ family protein [Candidatus Nealsonbacteria bacterium]
MLLTTTYNIEGKRVVKTLGLVKGNTIRARWIGRDIAAALKNLVGGEIKSYTKMISDAREEAIKRMVEQAEKMGANAIVGVRFTTSAVMGGASEILAYGTAVIVE